MSTRWVAALGAAGVLAGAGAALASVPAPATAKPLATGVASAPAAPSAQTELTQLAAELDALRGSIANARSQLQHLATQKGGQIAAAQASLSAEQASLEAESQQLAGEHAQLVAEAQQLSAEQAQLQQDAARLAAAPPVHATTGASGSDGTGDD